MIPFTHGQTSAALKCGIAAHTMSAQENAVRIWIFHFSQISGLLTHSAMCTISSTQLED